jgi:hypothetical protein
MGLHSPSLGSVSLARCPVETNASTYLSASQPHIHPNLLVHPTKQSLRRFLRTILIIPPRLHGSSQRPRIRRSEHAGTDAEEGECVEVYDQERGLYGGR